MGFGKEPTPCPVTRPEFRHDARPMQCILVDADGKQHPLGLAVKEFSTNSLGWNFSGKVDVPVGDKVCHCQVGVNVTIANSKLVPLDNTPPVPLPKAS